MIGEFALPIRSSKAVGHRLRILGDWLQRRQDAVRAVQWSVVAVYYILLVVPAVLPPETGGGLVGRLAAWAEMLFWAVWWPGVLLFTLLFGQFWCGVLCPDGTVSEFASRHGLGGKIPGWVRKPGWALAAIAVTTFYEHLSHAYASPRAILLSLGTTSLLALLFGLMVGRSKRVWCRYLCPVGSIFSLLARCAVLQFTVDRERWDSAPKPLPRAVDCPLLLDVRRLRSNEKCSMCGRCSGHRGAVELGMRWPGSEIVRMGAADIRNGDVIGIVFILFGVFFTASHAAAFRGWSSSLVALPLGGIPLWMTLAVCAVALAFLLWASLILLAGNVQVAKHLAYSLIPVITGGVIVAGLNYSLAVASRWGLHPSSAVQDAQFALLAGLATWSVVLGALTLRRYRLAWPVVRYLGHGLVVAGQASLYLAAALPQWVGHHWIFSGA